MGEGGESQRTAHAGGELFLKNEGNVIQKTTKQQLSSSSSSFSWKGACGETAAAGAEDAKEQRGSGGVPEETRRADPGAGAGEGDQAPGEGARGGAKNRTDARDRCSGWHTVQWFSKHFFPHTAKLIRI